MRTTRDLLHDLLRLALAATAAAAIAYQLAHLQRHASFRGAGNFFSFFTIQSNILAATMLALTAIVRRDERSTNFEAARGAAAFYITITGVVFALSSQGFKSNSTLTTPSSTPSSTT